MEINFIGDIIHYCDINDKREWILKVKSILENGNLECYVLKAKRII